MSSVNRIYKEKMMKKTKEYKKKKKRRGKQTFQFLIYFYLNPKQSTVIKTTAKKEIRNKKESE